MTRPSRRRTPLRLMVEFGTVSCPRHGRDPVAACLGCRWFQGTLDGPDREVLCTGPGNAPAIERRHGLIFDDDWPDA